MMTGMGTLGRNRVLGIGTLLVLALAATMRGQPGPNEAADTILYSGKIVTLWSERPAGQAVDLEAEARQRLQRLAADVAAGTRHEHARHTSLCGL